MAWTADLIFALRRLRRAPGFAAAAVLLLALGSGLAVCMFSARFCQSLSPVLPLGPEVGLFHPRS